MSVFIVPMNLQFKNMHDSRMTTASEEGIVVITNTSVRIRTRLATFCCINFFSLSPMEELSCVPSSASFDFEIFLYILMYTNAVTKIGMYKTTAKIILISNGQKDMRIASESARTQFPIMILRILFSERISFQVRGFLIHNDRSMAIRDTASKDVRTAIY